MTKDPLGFQNIAVSLEFTLIDKIEDADNWTYEYHHKDGRSIWYFKHDAQPWYRVSYGLQRKRPRFFGVESRKELMQLFARNGFNAERVLHDKSSDSTKN